MSGGNSPAGSLLRGLLWKNRIVVAFGLIANGAAALLEGSTLLLFTVALEVAVNGGTGTLYESFPQISSFLPIAIESAEPQQYFVWLILAAVLLQIGRSWFEFLGQAATGVVRSWAGGDLRRRLFAQFMRLDYARISQYKSGNLISRVNEVREVEQLVRFAGDIAGHGAIIIAYGSFLLWLSWSSTIVVLVIALLLTVSLRQIRSALRSHSQKFATSYSHINELVEEYLRGLRLLHIFDRQQYAKNRVEREVNDSVRYQRRAVLLNASVVPITQSLLVITVATLLIAGFEYVQRTGNISLLPRLTTFVFVLYRMLPRIQALNSSLAQVANTLPFAERIAEVLDDSQRQAQAAGVHSLESLQSVQLKGVSFAYPDSTENALTNISFSIKRGEMVALVGASGAGKSTIVDLLLRFYQPNSGTILVNERPLSSIDRSSWLNKIGVVDQDVFILHDSIAENIRFGRLNATLADIKDAARIANAHDFIENLSAGYGTVVGDRGFRLSGGQRQRLAIARAIIRDPELIILDEATSALDSESEQLIQQSLEELRKGRSILLIAHRLSTIASADKILVLHAGCLVESGTHEQLLTSSQHYANFWQLQTVA